MNYNDPTILVGGMLLYLLNRELPGCHFRSQLAFSCPMSPRKDVQVIFGAFRYSPGKSRSEDRHLKNDSVQVAIPADYLTRQQTNHTHKGDKTRRRHNMPGVVVNNPCKTIQTIFSEAQKTAATHRKLVNSLRTLQTTCLQTNKEDVFNEEFIRCLNRVLPVKKSEPTADRVIKFIGHFIQHVQDKSISRDFQLGDGEMLTG